MTDVPQSRIIVDMDKGPVSVTTGKRCDYVFFFVDTKNTLVTVSMELKSGRVDSISDVCEQLQQGATYAEDLVPKGSKSVCHPILFHGNSIHNVQRKKLNRAKVRFLGGQLTIKTARCGRPRNLALALQA